MSDLQLTDTERAHVQRYCQLPSTDAANPSACIERAPALSRCGPCLMYEGVRIALDAHRPLPPCDVCDGSGYALTGGEGVCEPYQDKCPKGCLPPAVNPVDVLEKVTEARAATEGREVDRELFDAARAYLNAPVCRLCAGRGRVHEDLTGDKPVYVQIQGPDLTDGKPHPYRVVPCRGCKGLEREPADDEVILTTKEFEALPEYSASIPTGVVVGKQWRGTSNANLPVPLWQEGKPSWRSVERNPQWWRGEYVESHESLRLANIEWKRITIHDSPLRVGDVCPACNGYGQVSRGSGMPGVYGARMEHCHDCNGTGQVQESLEVQFAKTDAADTAKDTPPESDRDGEDDDEA